MLVLKRRLGETVLIGDDPVITATILKIKGRQVCLGINAPPAVKIDRIEVRERKQKMYKGAAMTTK